MCLLGRPGLAGLALLRCAHPEPAAAVTGVAALLAWGSGHRAATAALVAGTVAASQLAVGWSNDALDAARDTAVGRTGKPVVSGAVSQPSGRGGGHRGDRWARYCWRWRTPPPRPWRRCSGSPAGWRTTGDSSRRWPRPVPYALSFAALPAFVVLALPARPPAWLLIAGALLGVGAHFANVLPDLADDAATGVHGLPHRLGPSGAVSAATAALFAATAVLVVGPPGPPTAPAVVAATVAAVAVPMGWYAHHAARRAGRRSTALFRTVMTITVIDVGLLLGSGSML